MKIVCKKFPIERLRRALQLFNFRDLRAKCQRVDDAQTLQQSDSAASKILCTPYRRHKRQFKNQIHAAQNRKPCPRPFVENCRRASLRETPAHYCDDFSAVKFFYLGDLMRVPRVKRIVLSDYPDCQLSDPQFQLKFLQQIFKWCILRGG